ncbi:MAG: efflux RND transporter permease subunit [Kiritimatiellae bacterium]|nr:efflux RND transporter permease subunit [Kiritimatiellia bacterium]
MKLSVRKAVDEIKTFSRTFVERPRFAMVIAIVLSIAGTMAMFNLPIAQYPQLTPPEIQVSYSYPGANAREVMNTVATPIEDEVNGVDDMIYMSSDSGDDGSYALTVSFEVGTDRDMDLVKVQNRISQAEAKLPTEVKQLGGRVRAQATDFLGFISIRSPKGTHSRLALSDYAYQNIQPVLLRVPGVGEAQIYGPKLSVRVWLDPQRMAAQAINSEEVISAISKQNIQASLGAVGASPTQDYGAFTYSLVAKGRLMTPEEFNEIVIRRDDKGGIVRLKDIARVEIGEQNYSFSGQFNGGNTINIAVQQKPGANAIKSMNALLRELEHLQKSFPEDMDYVIAYDATEYVRMCIREIVTTLLITFALVVLVCYMFLQDWRATLIPCLTIPVSICSTFILMAVLGYSINILTLFGLVLAIGVVVDDCIVVVERVQFIIETRGYNAKEATIQAMKDVTGAVIATTLVLLGIFVPVGFMSGITGRIYQQFSVTLSAAVCFSTLCALTLAPALCSLLLREARPFKHGPLAWFNAGIEKFKSFFVFLSKALARRLVLSAMLLILTILLTLQMFRTTQTSFLPDEDQRVVFVSMELPEGSTMKRSREVSMRATEMLLAMTNEVNSVLAINGWGMVGGRGENQTSLIVDLLDWSQRRKPEQWVKNLAPAIKSKLSAIPEATIQAFAPPAIPGLGMDNSIDCRLQSKESTDPMLLDETKNMVLAKLNALPSVMVAYSGYTAKTPHLRLEIDRTKAEMFHVPVATAYATLQNYLGSRYVNDVNLGTQVNRVTVQSDWAGRATPEAVANLYVRSDTGAMVPVGSLGTISREIGPRSMNRYQMFPAASLKIMPMPGVASGQVMKDVKRVMDTELPEGFGYEWSGITFQEQRNAGSAAPLIGLAILFGYLFLVAQYESWTIPLPVMLSIFVATFGALFGLRLFGLSLSVYAQLGLVLLVGLASKNAILLVEFAKDKREVEGYSIVDAAGAAAGERLRAILMTALTTLLGTLPLCMNLFFPRWCYPGAGVASRNAIGITEFFGMAASVVFGVLLVPGLYALFQTLRETVKRFFEYLSVRAFRARQLKDRKTAAAEGNTM